MLVTPARLRPVSLSTPALPAAAKQMAYSSVCSVSAGWEATTQQGQTLHTHLQQVALAAAVWPDNACQVGCWDIEGACSHSRRPLAGLLASGTRGDRAGAPAANDLKAWTWMLLRCQCW